jgi:hypothetical protein
MKKSLKKHSPALQLLIILGLYTGSIVVITIFDIIASPVLSGYGYGDLLKADSSIPEVITAWKVLTFIEPVLMYMIPALLFAMMVSRQPIEWLHLDKSTRLGPAIFVILFILAALPLSGLLFDWNATWGIAKVDEEQGMAIAKAIRVMPDFGSLLISLLLYAAIPAIARICFFFGVLQNVLVRMLPKTPWIAIIITSVIFTVSYFDWKWLAPMALIGFQFGAIYYLTGNLWLSILGNFVTTGYDWVESYLNQVGLIQEDPLHPSATPWHTAFISLIITAGLLWYVRKRIPRPVAVVGVKEYETDIESIGK